jgi:opacity protein-like surface antigen
LNGDGAPLSGRENPGGTLTNSFAVKSFGWLSCVFLFVVLSPVESLAEDSDQLRYYLGIRFGESNPATNAHDVVGFSVGANFSRYVGFELSGDFYELFVDTPMFGDVGELGTLALIPQVRVRYPLFNERLTPYLIAGAGVALTQFNDLKGPGFGLAISAGDQGQFMGAVGLGIEYFFADNIALGLEGKYLMSSDRTVTIENTPQQIDMNTGLAAVSLRMFYPQLRPHAFADSGPESPTRFYLGLRMGGGIPVNTQIFTGVEAEPEGPAYGGELNQLFGAALGANIGRHFGVELLVQGYEVNLALPDIGSVGEYAIHAIMPEFRLRWPLLNGRLEPYLLAGVGVTFAEYNDQTPASTDQNIKAEDFGVGALLGGGIEYFLMHNIALGFQTEYLIARGHTFQINEGPVLRGTLDSFLFSLSLRVFLFEL